MNEADSCSYLKYMTILSRICQYTYLNWYKKVDCIVLSSCYSSGLAKTLVEYVNCVIGTSDEIQPERTKEFAGLFYKYLCRGRSLGEAYDLACISFSDPQDKKPEIKCHNDYNSRETILYEEYEEYMKVSRSTLVDVFRTITLLVDVQPALKTGG